MTRARPESWVVVLGVASLSAWALLLAGDGELMPSALCSPDAYGRAPPLASSLDLLLLLNAPAKVLWGAVLMIAAMMLPSVVAPLRHVHDRSFARRRGRAMILFLAGYVVVWMCAALGLQAIVLAARWVSPSSLICFGLTAAAALIWQASPAKQWCLNRCHRRPQLAAFGAAADRDAFAFGLIDGVSCAGACWALMLLALSVADAHIIVMAVVALFVFAERLERPTPSAWRWRGACKAFRIAAMQLRMIRRRAAIAATLDRAADTYLSKLHS
jgi:predicted metal-binding membrane protein